MGRKIEFEQETCGRCLGTGEYSFNQMHGSVCYGCAGRKTRATKVAAQSREAIEAWKQEQWGKAASEITVGQAIWAEPRFNARQRWCRIVEVAEANPVHSRIGNVEEVVPYVTLYWMSNGEKSGKSVPQRSIHLVMPESFDDYFAFAATLPGVTVTETA